MSLFNTQCNVIVFGVVISCYVSIFDKSKAKIVCDQTWHPLSSKIFVANKEGQRTGEKIGLFWIVLIHLEATTNLK